MVRVALWTASLFSCSVVVWVGMHKEATHAALTTARRLLGESDSAKPAADATVPEIGKALPQGDAAASSTPKLRGAASQSLDTYYPQQPINPYSYQDPIYQPCGTIGYYDPNTNMCMPNTEGSLQYYSVQLVYGLLFYFLVSSKYPMFRHASPESAAIMAEPTPFRMKFGPICLQSMCCCNPMLAHVVRAVVPASNYFVTLVMSMLCPCVATYYYMEVQKIGEKLGSPAKGPVVNCFEAMLFPCCVVAQANEALDAATGMETGCFSVGTRRQLMAQPNESSAPYQAMPQAVSVSVTTEGVRLNVN